MKVDIKNDSLKLRNNPNVSHDDAAEMYACYGAHVSTDDHGDICVQAVEYDWLDDDKDAATWRQEQLAAGLSEEQVEEIKEWANRTNDYAVLALRDSYRAGLAKALLSWDECEQLVDLARRIRGDMEPIEEALARAATAAVEGDLSGCVEALQEARGLEADHGDDPSTSALAAQLLEEAEEEETPSAE